MMEMLEYKARWWYEIPALIWISCLASYPSSFNLSSADDLFTADSTALAFSPY
jgi:hypothetical protein